MTFDEWVAHYCAAGLHRQDAELLASIELGQTDGDIMPMDQEPPIQDDDVSD